MAVDFSALYKKTPGSAKRPPRLPVGDYPGIIRTYELGEANNEKKTPFLRYHVLLSDFPPGAPTEWSETDEEVIDPETGALKIWEYTRSDLDLSKRPQTFEFYFPVDKESGEPTDGSMFRFDEFMRSLQIDLSGYTSYEAIFPLPVGRRVMLSLVSELNPQSNRIFVRPRRMVGAP